MSTLCGFSKMGGARKPWLDREMFVFIRSLLLCKPLFGGNSQVLVLKVYVYVM